MHLYKMQISKDLEDNPFHQLQQSPCFPQLDRLKDLTLHHRHPQSPLLSSPSFAMLSDLLSPCSSPGLKSADYIGMESCVDVLRDDDESQCPNNNKKQQNLYNQKVQDKREERRQALMKRKELPPPINLPSQMPWVLKRHYTGDGRLVLIEEKVRHHEYFRAHRSNGRLTLQLVHLDDQVLSPPKDNVEEVQDYDDNDNEESEDEFYDDNDDDENYGEEGQQAEEDVVDDVPEEQISKGNCFNFNTVGSPCYFEVPV